MHTLIIVNPGHFHAALSLRERNSRLSDDVWVYAEAGVDLDRFESIVQSFNHRAIAPTRWNLHFYRGADYMAKLLAERRGDVAIIAGRNDTKLATIDRLQSAGLAVLADKPWLIAADQIDALRRIAVAQPLARDIMTEPHAPANRLLNALIRMPDLFGALRDDPNEPAIDIASVHHLCKLVNGAPLVRPAWHFDVAVQGEGIVDTTTHLIDLAQRFVGGAPVFDFDRDVSALRARQWSTDVPRALLTRVTGLRELPEPLRRSVVDGALPYRCNALLAYRLRGIPVRIEALWALEEPPGGSDQHRITLRGSQAELTFVSGGSTGQADLFEVKPRHNSQRYGDTVNAAIAELQREFAGLRAEPAGERFRLIVPPTLHTTHEQHFAWVLRDFLDDLDSARATHAAASALVTKYALIAAAQQASRA